jgi:hypothetical protein
MMTHHRVLLGVLAGAVLGYAMGATLSGYVPWSYVTATVNNNFTAA